MSSTEEVGLEPKKHPEKALSAAGLRSLEPGRHADGNGLYLVVDDSGARRWVLRTVVKGKRCDIGLGGLSIVTLKDAREAAAKMRKTARSGGDPLADRRTDQRVVPTFDEDSREFHDKHSDRFRNPNIKSKGSTAL